MNVNNLLLVINTWGECPGLPDPCLADIAPRPDRDGVVNTGDMLAVINAWGPCPIEGVIYTSNGTGGGDWFDPNTWNPPGVPGTEHHFDVVRILEGDTVTQSQQYPYTLALYSLRGGTHVFAGNSDIAALIVQVRAGQWERQGEIEPLIAIRNSARASKPINGEYVLLWDCPVFCQLLANPNYPYNLLQSCQENPCISGPSN